MEVLLETKRGGKFAKNVCETADLRIKEDEIHSHSSVFGHFTHVFRKHFHMLGVREYFHSLRLDL